MLTGECLGTLSRLWQIKVRVTYSVPSREKECICRVWVYISKPALAPALVSESCLRRERSPPQPLLLLRDQRRLRTGSSVVAGGTGRNCAARTRRQKVTGERQGERGEQSRYGRTRASVEGAG